MNRIHLFLLFVIFLLIPLSVPVFSSVIPAVKPGCDTAVQEPAGGRDCAAGAVLVASVPEVPVGELAAAQSAAPAGLQDFIQNDQTHGRSQWLLLAIFAGLILLAARIAPSLK
jgi:hypothetical protein